jgi:hypothetical protein
MISKFKRLFVWKNRILNGFTLWPTIVMLSFLLEEWVFYYHDNDDIGFPLFVIFVLIFPAVCFIWALVSLIRKKPKSSLSFLTPALTLVFFLFSPWSNPVRDILSDSRHYVEFQIQKRFYFPEMNEPDNLPPYKEWLIKEYPNVSKYTIVYDLNDSLDEREKRKKAELHDPQQWGYSIKRVGRHFYMLHEYYY